MYIWAAVIVSNGGEWERCWMSLRSPDDAQGMKMAAQTPELFWGFGASRLLVIGQNECARASQHKRQTSEIQF